MIDRFYTLPQVAYIFKTTQREVMKHFTMYKFGNCLRIKEADVYKKMEDLQSQYGGDND